MRARVLAISAALACLSLAWAPSWPRELTRAFGSESAYRDLVQQCEFGPRVPGTTAHAECEKWLTQNLDSCADSVSLQRFSAMVSETRLPLTNIVATFNPEGKRHIILCAHWDSRPTADRDPDPANHEKPILGANDGASGVAVLLEIARALKLKPPKQRVTIVLFDVEDYGQSWREMCLGSQHFAREYAGPKVDWAVLLDMVGDRDLRLAPDEVSQHKAPEVVERIWSAAESIDAEAFVRGPGPAIFDDHVWLLRHGIPCIDVIDFEYPYWHTLQDTPDKCSPESLGQVGRTLLAALESDGI